MASRRKGGTLGSGFTTETQRSQRGCPNAMESSVYRFALIGVYQRLSAVPGPWSVPWDPKICPHGHTTNHFLHVLRGEDSFAVFR